MKSKFLTIGIALLVAGNLLTSCKKSGVSSAASANSQLAFGLQTDSASINLAFSPTTGLPAPTGGSARAVSTLPTIVWTSGIANISGFKFEARKKGLNIEVESHNVAHIDLLALATSLTSVTLDTGTYKEIEIRVVLTKTTSADLPLVLKGTFTTQGGAAVPIELDFNDNAEIRAGADNVIVDGKTDITTIVKLHLNRLLRGITSAALDQATRTNGTIVISANSNASFYDQISHNLTSCGESEGFEKHEKRK